MSAVMLFLMNTQMKLCIALGPVLREKLMAAEFSSRCNFQHTLGAIDGKHVATRCPKDGWSLYFNYQGLKSIILFAILDASSDEQIFNQLQLRSGIIDGLYRSLQLNHFPVMTVQCHTFSLGMMPFHFVAHETKDNV